MLFQGTHLKGPIERNTEASTSGWSKSNPSNKDSTRAACAIRLQAHPISEPRPENGLLLGQGTFLPSHTLGSAFGSLLLSFGGRAQETGIKKMDAARGATVTVPSEKTPKNRPQTTRRSTARGFFEFCSATLWTACKWRLSTKQETLVAGTAAIGRERGQPLPISAMRLPENGAEAPGAKTRFPEQNTC